MSEQKLCVLIAEDNPGLARVLSFKFKSSGYEPVVCADGQLAWEAFHANPVVAVVSDQEMPRLSGVELCRKLRKDHPELPFFLVTGRQLELSSTGISEELKIQRIFGKPFSPADVVAAVGEAIKSVAASC